MAKNDAKKEGVSNTNVNTNNNTNNVNVNVKIQEPKSRAYKKKKTSWLTKAIVGGLITLATCLILYKLTGTNGNDNFDTAQPNGSLIEGKKQN